MPEYCPSCARQLGFEPEPLSRGEVCEGCGAIGPVRNPYPSLYTIAIVVILVLSTIIAAVGCKQPNLRMVRLSQKWMLAKKMTFQAVVTSQYFQPEEHVLNLSDSADVILNGLELSVGKHKYEIGQLDDSVMVWSDPSGSYMFFKPGASFWKNNKPGISIYTGEKLNQ